MDEEKSVVNAKAQGEIKKRKTPLREKFFKSLYSVPKEDVEAYIIDQVIVPSILNAIADILGDAVDYVFRGRVGGRTRASGGGNSYNGQRDYGAYSKSPSAPQRAPNGMRGIDNVSFKSRAEAMDVLEELVNALDRFKKVSVYNFYEAAKLSPPNGYSDYNYGWYDLSTARVENYHGDWYIVMPRIVELQ